MANVPSGDPRLWVSARPVPGSARSCKCGAAASEPRA
jgi:hypothetical protein